jgi:glucuronide carrier protein
VSDFLQSFSRTPNEVDASVSADAETDTELVLRNIADVIDRVKDSGGVIVGRDATVVLSGMQGALHVRLEAPVEARVSRAAEALGISLEDAARRQQREDRVRTLMSQRLMHWDPADASHYDLVIDTRHMSLDQAVDMIAAVSEAERGG